jgi:hypothetical protein
MASIARRSTGQYDFGTFSPHGHADISFDGRIMRFESTGPFNRELMVAGGIAIRELVAECPPKGPWAEIVRLHGSALIAMDVIAALDELITSLASEGIASTATAIIASSGTEGLNVMIKPYAAVYAAHARPFATFAVQAEAEEWIALQLQAPQAPASQS